jgi:hypothetical protein
VVGGNGGADTNNAAALSMNFSIINNQILSQILMEASRPKFQGTAEHFSEFRRQGGEYQKLLRSILSSIGETQIFSIFKTCLDPATALKLQREHDDNSRLSAGGFMAKTERDFG